MLPFGTDRVAIPARTACRPQLVRAIDNKVERDPAMTQTPDDPLGQFLRALDHPIRAMPKAGIRIHPNTEDPALHLIDSTGAWPPDETRRQWQAEWSTESDRLRSAMVPSSQALP
jgi:hypothetical protein